MTTIASAPEEGAAEPSSVTRPPKASSSQAVPSHPASNVDITSDSTITDPRNIGTSAESAVFEAVTTLPQVLKIIGSVFAPTTLLTSLLFLFGWMYAISFFQYFGVPITVLNLPLQDYLILSADGLIVPLIIVVGAGLLALWTHRLRFDALTPKVRRIALRALLFFTALSGLLLVSLALANVIGEFTFSFPEGRGLSFSIGVILLAYAARLMRLFVVERRRDRIQVRPAAVVVAEWGALFILMSVGLFWAVGSYAIGVGTGHAQELAASLPRMPDVVVYSEKSLNLRVSGVTEVPCKNSDGAYRFGYEGLKLVPQSGDQYLFLPANWTPENGAAVVLPRSQAPRLELSPAGQTRRAIC